jgi:hypothetical protein
MTTAVEIGAYLEVLEKHDSKNWTWNYVQAGSYWHVKYDGVTPSCEINIGLSGSVLYIHVDLSPYLHLRPDCSQALYLFLLRLNDDLSIIKFGLGPDGKVALMAEVPAGLIGEQIFENLLQRMIAVFAQYRQELVLLASEDELAQLLLRINQADDRSKLIVRVLD